MPDAEFLYFYFEYPTHRVGQVMHTVGEGPSLLNSPRYLYTPIHKEWFSVQLPKRDVRLRWPLQDSNSGILIVSQVLYRLCSSQFYFVVLGIKTLHYIYIIAEKSGNWKSPGDGGVSSNAPYYNLRTRRPQTQVYAERWWYIYFRVIQLIITYFYESINSVVWMYFLVRNYELSSLPKK